MNPRGRLTHFLCPGSEWRLQKIQEDVDAEREKLQKEAKCG
jgi:hypothetical protein